MIIYKYNDWGINEDFWITHLSCPGSVLRLGFKFDRKPHNLVCGACGVYVPDEEFEHLDKVAEFISPSW